MKFAVISDVHSNLEALNAVMEDIDSENIKDIYFLGDIVGYGANPLEVLEIADNFRIKVLGNHDQALFEPSLLFFFNPDARKALQWTKEVLLEAGRQDFIEQLQETPFRTKKNEYLFSHGDYKKNQIYLKFQDETLNSFNYMDLNDLEVLFVGHSHYQGYFHRNGSTFCKEQKELSSIDKFRNQKLIVNPGGVGQPRDGNPKAAYVVVNEDKIQFRRVSYDIQAAAAKIKAERGLPDSLAFRLFEGL